MIVDRKPSSEIKRAALEGGMTSLRNAALEKAFSGLTTLKEINKVTFIE
jgi:type IV pilus assembly protein PilB